MSTDAAERRSRLRLASLLLGACLLIAIAAWPLQRARGPRSVATAAVSAPAARTPASLRVAAHDGSRKPAGAGDRRVAPSPAPEAAAVDAPASAAEAEQQHRVEQSRA